METTEFSLGTFDTGNVQEVTNQYNITVVATSANSSVFNHLGMVPSGNCNEQYVYVTETVQTQADGTTVYEEPHENSADMNLNENLESNKLDLLNNPSCDTGSVKFIINNAVQYCKDEDISNPVEILRYVQTVLHSGRKLDIEDPSTNEEGETNFILVDRSNILETGLEEIRSIEETKLPVTLEVQFYDEMAVDCGGPQKEFFRIILKSIKEKYFDHGLREHRAIDYTTVGKIFGLSILQNGSIPRFLEESLLTKTFSESTESVSIMNFKHGLDCLGIYTLGMQLPMFLHLLRPTDVKLTLKAVINILKPNFSEEGSNRRQLQNKVYAAFTRYLRSVASGRRGALLLSDILQFTTEANEEPVLGFSIHPSIDFVHVDTLPSFIPTANTCVNGLTLPCPTADTLLPSDNELFALYDYAFVNAFYGLL